MKNEDAMETDPQAEASPAGGPEGAVPPPSGGTSGVEELIRQHRELDERLRAFAAARNPSLAERLEVAVMKKRKLALKDRIVALAGSS